MRNYLAYTWSRYNRPPLSVYNSRSLSLEDSAGFGLLRHCVVRRFPHSPCKLCTLGAMSHTWSIAFCVRTLCAPGGAPKHQGITDFDLASVFFQQLLASSLIVHGEPKGMKSQSSCHC